jgi:hypothetical protein
LESCLASVFFSFSFQTDLCTLENPTLLQLATSFQKENVVEFLLQWGADPNAFGDCEESSVHLAIENGFTSILELLLDNGGDVNKTNNYAYPPVFLAIQNASPEILLRLLEHNPNKETKFQGQGALHFAVRENKITHAELLIGYGYSHEALNRDNCTPIQLAQRLSYTGMLSVLDNPVTRQRLLMAAKHPRPSRKVEPIKDEPKPPPSFQIMERPARPARPSQPAPAIPSQVQPEPPPQVQARPPPEDPPPQEQPRPAQEVQLPIPQDFQPQLQVRPPPEFQLPIPQDFPSRFRSPPAPQDFPQFGLQPEFPSAFGAPPTVRPPFPRQFPPAPFRPPEPRAYPGMGYSYGSPMYGMPFQGPVAPGQTFVPFDEFVHLQKRILILEQVTSQVLAGQACCVCRTKPGTSQCPVCGLLFCAPEWAAHVAHGCT